MNIITQTNITMKIIGSPTIQAQAQKYGKIQKKKLLIFVQVLEQVEHL